MLLPPRSVTAILVTSLAAVAALPVLNKQDMDASTDAEGPLFIVYETFTGDASMQVNALQFVNQLTTVTSTTTSQVVTPAVGSQHIGWGSKAMTVQAYLSKIVAVSPDRPVFVLDARDVLLNGNDLALDDIMDRFIALKLTKDQSKTDAVIVSAEPQCCVTALSNQQPYTYFHANGTRADRSCESGTAGCDSAGNYGGQWERYLTDVAPTNPSTEVRPAARYPNAGLVAGSAKAIFDLYNDLNLTETEDDQAVLTEFFLRWPDRIILDYDQVLFGNSKWSAGADGCQWKFDHNLGMMIHSSSTTSTPIAPAFLHFSNAFASCYDKVADSLGVAIHHKVEKVKQERRWRRSGGYNYVVTLAPTRSSSVTPAVTLTTTLAPSQAPTPGTPAIQLEMAVSKPLTDFTLAESQSLKNGVRTYLITTTSLTDSDIVRIDLSPMSTQRKRSATIAAIAVLNESVGLTLSDASTAVAAAESSNDTITFTVDGQVVTVNPTISEVSIPATGTPTSAPTASPAVDPTSSPTTVTPPIESGDDEALSGASIAAIIICSLLAIGIMVVLTIYGKSELDKRQQANISGGAKSPRVSISEAFDEALPNHTPIEAEEWCAAQTTVLTPPKTIETSNPIPRMAPITVSTNV